MDEDASHAVPALIDKADIPLQIAASSCVLTCNEAHKSRSVTITKYHRFTDDGIETSTLPAWYNITNPLAYLPLLTHGQPNLTGAR